MRTNPLKHYRVPVYPTRLQVLADPLILRRNIPAGWRTCAEMAGAVTVFLAANGFVKAGEKQ